MLVSEDKTNGVHGGNESDDEGEGKAVADSTNSAQPFAEWSEPEEESGDARSTSSESSECAEDTDEDTAEAQAEDTTFDLPRRTASWPAMGSQKTASETNRLHAGEEEKMTTEEKQQATRRPEPGRCRYGNGCYRQECHYWHPWQVDEYNRFMTAFSQVARCRFGHNCCLAGCTYWHPQQDDAFKEYMTQCLASFKAAPLAPFGSRPAQAHSHCPRASTDAIQAEGNKTDAEPARRASAFIVVRDAARRRR